MFDKHRSHLQLQMDILEVIAVARREPYLITQIQQKTQMNPEQVLRYLVEMASKGLLTVEFIPHAKVAKREYKITANGRSMLREWVKFKARWKELVIDLEEIDKLRS